MYLSYASIKRLWYYTYGRHMPVDMPFNDGMDTLWTFHGNDALNAYARLDEVERVKGDC